MMRISRIKGNREFNYKILQWQIVKHCNLSCDYCIVEAPKAEHEICTNYRDIILYLNKALSEKAKILTIPRLWGGEPTIHPDFLKMCELFTVPFGVYSNMHKDYNFYKNLLQYEYLTYYYCSLHYHAVKDNLDDFISKISLFSNKHVHVNIMLEREYFDEIEQACINIRKLFPDYRVSIKVIDKVPGYYDFNEVHKRFKKYIYDDQWFDFNGKRIHRFHIAQSELNTLENLIVNTRTMCNINKYFNRLDIDGSFYSCIDGQNKVTDVYDSLDNYSKLEIENLFCYKRVCCPYLFEYGTKIKI